MSEHIKTKFSALLSKHRRGILLLLDIVVVAVAYSLSWVLISGRADMRAYFSLLISSCFLFVACFAIVYATTGMYDSLWRYAEIVEIFRCCMSSVIATVIFIVMTQMLFQERRFPHSVYGLSAIIATTLTLYTRLVYRMYRNFRINKMGKKRRRVLVVGAGDAASTLLHEINKNPTKEMNVICAVDDDKNKVGRNLLGVQVMGTTDDIPTLVQQCQIETILIAIPTLDGKNKKRILDICASTSCNIRMLPDIVKIIKDDEDILSRITDVKVEDLLGREPIILAEEAYKFVNNKTVMVTGGGGSIGSELCRQIAGFKPKKLIILDIYENSAYSIQQELRRKYGKKLDLDVRIASVRDTKKIDDLFNELKPQVVFHAAAHKHVPLMEDSPEEAVKNNVFGTYNCALCAEKYNVEKFVLISTDKAVNPTNVMGATKRICEMIIQNIAENTEGTTTFAAVRFGNVLGSNGSVIPLFKEQLAEGGPLTVTDKEIIRYFMTIPEAVSLVLEAGAISNKSGEIFVLDMGEPVKIVTLAENLIKMAGLIPYKDIDIVFTGLRPGEKLYEELLMDEEGLQKTENNKIFIGAPLKMDASRFFSDLLELKSTAYENDREKLLAKIKEMVPTFNHMVVDYH
ncbi:MAG: polysaccharide biosynthesis protein [Oscillospiraceae bacterium]|nr:polysaccharide biosynthesis protein [Oscillospiraceae bacterium]